MLLLQTLSLQGEAQTAVTGHPRLYFTAAELTGLRAKRTQGVHARIWKRLEESAAWCLTRPPRAAWIPPVTPDPIYENLYDRFYAMMHDMAVMEHLAFAYAYSGETRYADAGKQWTLACCRVWRREADGEPDQNKAYAATRLLKGIAVSYDLLYDALSEAERQEIRAMLTEVGGKYYRWYVQNPAMAGPEQNKHHGSVEAASFGVTALALLGEVPEAADWLAMMEKKHTEFLLPHALMPSGTQEQSSNFWASTMHYRLFFLDALRRVTGRDLFKKYKAYMDGRIALAAVAAPKRPGHDEDQQSILFAPSYGQLNYWSPVLLYLAREYRRPIYQYLALWDEDLGAIQRTRYVTPKGEELVFSMAGYVYAWYDSSVPARVERNLPLSFEFLDAYEIYARSSYQENALVVGMQRGQVIVHAGGRPVLIEVTGPFQLPKPVNDVTRAEQGKTTVIHCHGVEDTRYAEQTLTLQRPGLLTLNRKTEKEAKWWFQGEPTREDNTLTWPDGTQLRVVKGNLVSLDPEGHLDHKSVGNGVLKLADPMPRKYPLVTARPEQGELVVEVRTPPKPRPANRVSQRRP